MKYDFDDILDAIFQNLIKIALVSFVFGAVILIWTVVFYTLKNGIK